MSTKTVRTGARRAAVVLTVATASLVAAAAAAQAHVTVNPNTAAQGSYSKVTFRVPNETKTASVTALEIDIPADTPIASVQTRPVPGWTAQETTSTLATPIQAHGSQVTQAVSKIVWSGGEIPPGQFQEFDVSLGPLPETSQIVFKALQTYSDGSVVRWIDVPQDGQPAPAHPAPILHLTAAAAATGGTATPAAASSVASAAPTVALASEDSTASKPDNLARFFGIAGLVVGVAGFANAFLVLRRRRDASGPAS